MRYWREIEERKEREREVERETGVGASLFFSFFFCLSFLRFLTHNNKIKL